MRLHHWRNTR